jgi:hypothetical protein
MRKVKTVDQLKPNIVASLGHANLIFIDHPSLNLDTSFDEIEPQFYAIKVLEPDFYRSTSNRIRTSRSSARRTALRWIALGPTHSVPSSTTSDEEVR